MGGDKVSICALVLFFKCGIQYWLTKKGVDTYPHSLSLMFWGDSWLADPKGPPVYVSHKPCGHRLGATVVCGECKEALTFENVKAGRFRKAGTL